MCKIEYYEDQPQSFHSKVEDKKTSIVAEHCWVGQSSDEVREEVTSLVVDVMDSRGIELDHDIVVRVPEFMYVRKILGGLSVNVASMLAAGRGTFDEDRHVLTVGGFMWKKMTERDRRNTIAHELCHAYAQEVHGVSEEDSHEFKHVLDKFDAPEGTEDHEADMWAAYEEHPAHDHVELSR